MRKDILERKDDLLKWIKEKRTKAYICKELSCKPVTLDSSLTILNIEYEGCKNWAKGKQFSNRWKPAVEYLKDDSTTNTHRLKNKLIRDNIKEKRCEICNLTTWNKQEIPLELHHIDGNRFNNKLDNLRILCANCHAQMDNNSGKSNRKDKQIVTTKEKVTKTREVKIKNYCLCGKEIQKNSKMCEDCFKKSLRKVQRPTYEQLLKEVSESNYLQVGKKYGVSDNAIRKWIKQYEKKADVVELVDTLV